MTWCTASSRTRWVARRGQGRESDHGNADSFGNHLTNAFSAICCLQKSRFTASKPSIFAIASDEKFIRHLVTSFHQRSLSQSAYQNDPTKPNFGTLTATTYGNGAKISSRYDDFNRVTGVVYGEETAPRYEYDYNAKGQVARVRDNLLNRTTQSEYDLANRPVRVKTAEAGQHVYTGQVAYDNVYGNLSEFTEKVGENRQEFGTKFGYDDENRPTSLTYSASGKEIGQSTTTIDKLNRTTFSAVKLGSKTFTSEYHFAAGGYGTGSVTNLVSSITQPGCNCGYGYDDNGNIASATLNGKWTGYTYDALGQLIRVNDRSDTSAGDNGSTWVYEYDRGGNILSKKLYPYANTSSEPLQTMRFSYGNANWKDQLTAVDGTPITYDAIGNPLNDGTWTYTWENGRQLARMQSANVDAKFVYNENGLRVQKIINGVVTDYVLHGKNVVHMTRGADELHFFYDAQNRPAVVVYNGTAYAYVKNLQGDVITILDGAGNVVVSYVYDAWGMPIGKSGTLAETLGTLNPFRYRGYVFDEETGLYYLRSRYYHASISRFLCIDRWLGGTSDGILSHNPLCYCKNSPVMNADADGQFLAAICAAIGATVVKAVVGAVVGAIVNCASEYVDDVVENYQKGKRGWDMFVPDSPAEKYAGAAVGGAIAGIGCSSLLWTGVMGATGNVVDGWIAGELDVEGALSGDRRAIENIGLSAASGAYGNVVGKIIGDKLLWDHDYKVHKMPRYARKELATQWFSGGRNEALKQFMNMPIDEFASHFFIRHTIMPATYSTTTNWSMMQISSE